MDGYKHFAVTQLINGLDVVIDGYTSGFPEMTKEGAILILEDGPRSFYQQWGDIRNSNGQPIYKLVNGQMVERTADELFDLSEYKQEQIDLLSCICNETILGTFTSSAMGEGHIYVFDMEAQMNLAGTKEAFRDNLITTVEWNTRDVGVLVHDATQFNQLWLDGFTHKMSNIGKFRSTKTQIEADTITTKEEVDTIVDSIVW